MYGVNLGGWMVLERFINTDIFDGANDSRFFLGEIKEILGKNFLKVFFLELLMNGPLVNSKKLIMWQCKCLKTIGIIGYR